MLAFSNFLYKTYAYLQYIMLLSQTTMNVRSDFLCFAMTCPFLIKLLSKANRIVNTSRVPSSCQLTLPQLRIWQSSPASCTTYEGGAAEQSEAQRRSIACQNSSASKRQSQDLQQGGLESMCLSMTLQCISKRKNGPSTGNHKRVTSQSHLPNK